jgi:hypothetical protein
LLTSYLIKGSFVVGNWYGRGAPKVSAGSISDKQMHVGGTVRRNRKEMRKFTQQLEKEQVEVKHTNR